MSIRHPEIKWAQREDKVYITVVLANTKDAKVSLAPEGVSSFSATAGQYSYDLKLELADKVNVDESKINIDERSIFCILEKAEPKWWNKLLKGDAKTPHYVEVDWDKWVDEDDEAGLAADLDMGGMDFSKFGDMGGFGGNTTSIKHYWQSWAQLYGRRSLYETRCLAFNFNIFLLSPLNGIFLADTTNPVCFFPIFGSANTIMY